MEVVGEVAITRRVPRKRPAVLVAIPGDARVRRAGHAHQRQSPAREQCAVTVGERELGSGAAAGAASVLGVDPQEVVDVQLGSALEQVEQALQEGLDVNSADEEGYSALHAAAENDHLEVVKLLISKGADINHRSTYTALELAEMAENTDVVAYLKSL